MPDGPGSLFAWCRFASSPRPSSRPCSSPSHRPAARCRSMPSAICCCSPATQRTTARSPIWSRCSTSTGWPACLSALSAQLRPPDRAGRRARAGLRARSRTGERCAAPVADRAPQCRARDVQRSLATSTGPRPGTSASIRLARAAGGGFVYPVQNGRAADLAEVLGEIFNVQSAAVGPEDLLAPGLDPATIGSSLIGRGEPGSTEAAAEPIEPPQTTGPGSALPGLQAGRSIDPAAARRSPTLPSAGAPEIRIIGNSTTNSLVIWATPREYRKIRRALEQLDILPLQVLIEATVAEVHAQRGAALRGRVVRSLRVTSRRPPPAGGSGFTGPLTSLFPGFSALLAGSDGAVVLERARGGQRHKYRLLAASSGSGQPDSTYSGRRSSADHGPAGDQRVGCNNAPIVNSIELRDTGVILSVTPRVNASGLVVVELQQEVSNVVRDGARPPSPSRRRRPSAQRQISSTVAVQSGETIVLGGLITDNVDR